MLFATAQRSDLLIRDRASGEPTHEASSGKRCLTVRAAEAGSAFASARMRSCSSKAQARTSGARSPAHSTASLTVHAPGCVVSVSIQLQVVSSGNTIALRSSRSSRTA